MDTKEAIIIGTAFWFIIFMLAVLFDYNIWHSAVVIVIYEIIRQALSKD